jgi:hypothetical protein
MKTVASYKRVENTKPLDKFDVKKNAWSRDPPIIRWWLQQQALQHKVGSLWYTDHLQVSSIESPFPACKDQKYLDTTDPAEVEVSNK